MPDQAELGAESDRPESGEPGVPAQRWQALEARWKSILVLEGNIDASRMSMEGLRAEMEGAFRKSMNVEEKVNALQADVAQWNKAKNRIHYALPKVREFIHRATWVPGQSERKKLEELFKNHVERPVPISELDQVSEQLDALLKERQILASQGNTVAQECRSICAEIQRAFSTLARNAVDRARKKRDAKREK